MKYAIGDIINTLLGETYYDMVGQVSDIEYGGSGWDCDHSYPWEWGIEACDAKSDHITDIFCVDLEDRS